MNRRRTLQKKKRSLTQDEACKNSDPSWKQVIIELVTAIILVGVSYAIFSK